MSRIAAATLAATLLASSTALAADTPWTALSKQNQTSIQRPAILAESDGTTQVLHATTNAALRIK